MGNRVFPTPPGTSHHFLEFLFADGAATMPISIILLLTTALILTLSMVHGTDWSPDALAAARLALAVLLAVVVLWIVVDAIRALTDRWRRFLSRPY